MIKNKKCETLLSIIIGIFIISFVILGIINIMTESKSIIEKFDKNKDIIILKQNSVNIIKRIDTSNIYENTIFYVYKNETNKTITTKTGSEYKYIDKYGNNVLDINNFNGELYSRIFYLERDDNSIGEENQIIKANIKKLIRKD